jgi:hypothetical protein
MTTPAGYAHPRYAASFAQWGTPAWLPDAGGALLRRAIPGSDRTDATGLYPLACFADWRALRSDVDAHLGDAVSLVLVADPFGGHDPHVLAQAFDLVAAWKPHLVVDFEDPALAQPLPRPHRRNVERARERAQVDVVAEPASHLDDWCDLYAQLCARHGITGMRAFSREAFALQLATPGMVMLRARVDGELAGLHLWVEQGDVAYGHLGATNARGYEAMAAYALYDQARSHFRGRVRWLDLGGGAGADTDEDDGLVRFKRGFATGARPAYLCKRVLDGDAYARLSAGRTPGTTYFPAYRAGG